MGTGVVLLITAILTATAMAILGLNKEHSVRDLRYTLFHSMLDVININLYAFGQHDRAWKATLAYNDSLASPRMQCIMNATLCNYTVKEDIVLRYPTNATTGSIYYDERSLSGSQAYDGFRMDGTVCDYDDNTTAFNRRVQNNGCLLSVRVRWQPWCITNCMVGPNRMIFDLTYSTPRIDERGNILGSKNFFLPAIPGEDSGPMPIYNPFR